MVLEAGRCDGARDSCVTSRCDDRIPHNQVTAAIREGYGNAIVTDLSSQQPGLNHSIHQRPSPKRPLATTLCYCRRSWSSTLAKLPPASIRNTETPRKLV